MFDEQGRTFYRGQEALDKFAEVLGSRLRESIPTHVGATGLDQSMKKAILGHHQDQMVNPEVREGGPGSGPTKKMGVGAGDLYKAGYSIDKIAKTLGIPYQKAFDKLEKEGLIKGWSGFQKSKEAASLQLPEDMLEHGVKGMKWGIRHVRKDVEKPGARGGKSPKSAHGRHAVQKNKPIQKRDLANDPKTMSMMSATHGTLKALNGLHAKQQAEAQQRNQQGLPARSSAEHHGEALQALKELGWTILKSFARMAGLGGATDMVSSIVRSPSGQKAHLQTDRKTGKHSLATDRPPRRRREARTFESRVGSFLRESRRSKGIYYAREIGRYGTDAEDRDLETIREAFEGDRVDFSKTKRHAELGMGYFHEKIDRAKAVVIKPTRGKKLTTGVYSEARHAIKKGIPVYALRKGKLRRVKSVEVLESNNKSGHFGKIVYQKRRKH